MNYTNLWLLKKIRSGEITPKQAFWGVTLTMGFLTLGIGLRVADDKITEKNKDEPVTVWTSDKNTAEHTVFELEDHRGLFNKSRDMVMAENASDSLYAEKHNLDIGHFISTKQILLSTHVGKGRGWNHADTVHFTMR